MTPSMSRRPPLFLLAAWCAATAGVAQANPFTTSPAQERAAQRLEPALLQVLGRHFVLRGMADLEEARDLARYLDTLDPSQREKLYSRRKWHKEIAVFLHEWGTPSAPLTAARRRTSWTRAIRTPCSTFRTRP